MSPTDTDTHTCRVLAIEPVTHNVNRIVADKPEGYTFTPGQATEVALDRDGWRDEKRPFTFTSLGVDIDVDDAASSVTAGSRMSSSL